jgi:hypothetical protein
MQVREPMRPTSKGLSDDMLAAFGPRAEAEVEAPRRMRPLFIPAALLLMALLGIMLPF